ncbi:uncharacterized protein DUF2029 [Roseibium hamelinense]|uniref:Uncharacterized protein DUF2029 n=1 Tax=Roseibium hamelinense TaxID=150831 RepID=A0A562T2F2_9HYPH|nr:glycosyltransferase family 87 protein [Roseibium hamelinense]MTI43383.1 DUF2029 domain-containing protein [Roseibium hamelinense]TWI87583.1 uncharacterized protein DUF2029 [Roseibium hamelinense]
MRFELHALITGERVRIASQMAPVAYLFALCFFLYALGKPVYGAGFVFPIDFLCFWTAAEEARLVGPAFAYENQFLKTAQAPFTRDGMYFPFMYPPTFLLTILPLSSLSFLTAYIVFMGLSLSVYAVTGRLVWGNWQGAMFLLAFPATLNAAAHGQTSLLTCACLGVGLYCLKNRRMVLAGVCFALMTFKPQAGVLIPFALLAGRYWQAFIVASFGTILWALISWAVLGTDTWLAFLEQSSFARSLMSSGVLEFHKMISLNAALRLGGVNEDLAIILQAALSCLLLAVVVLAWSKDAIPFELKAVVLVSAGLLVTPYSLSYDLTLLVLAVLFFAIYARAYSYRSSDIYLLVIAVAFSGATRILGDVGIPIGPLPAAAMLYLGLSRLQDHITYSELIPFGAIRLKGRENDTKAV